MYSLKSVFKCFNFFKFINLSAMRPNENSNSLVQIKSFVMFDLETSGLHPRTRITEIGLVAALREHIDDAYKSGIRLPRVVHKLNLCVYPSRLIESGASNVSGLDNMLLQEQKPFDCDTVSIMEGFLRRLPPPVCLVAHNGDRFDFPVLQAELKRINKVLPDNLLCADSYKCFKELLTPKKTKSPVNNGCDHVSNKAEPMALSDLGIYPLSANAGLEDEYDGVLFDMLVKLENDPSSAVSRTLPSQVEDRTATTVSGAHIVTCTTPFKNIHPHSQDVQKQNETTPKHVEKIAFGLARSNLHESRKTACFDSPSTSLIQQQNETTPKATVRNKAGRGCGDGVQPAGSVDTTDSISNKRKFRKRLDFVEPPNGAGAQPKSFKLTDVYEFLDGSTAENAHTADGDALNLLRIIGYFLPDSGLSTNKHFTATRYKSF
ncbi:uncharacterized protein LOC134536824 isoform X2 [Bacillus rossius redtenbacheri]|uniref:uncharacterized protein LOC134536824 isoform X2 n=1 Tax=Bacillus rossius redtenbacheri TaxID=93214 RepID=UPI002FDE3FE5